MRRAAGRFEICNVNEMIPSNEFKAKTINGSFYEHKI